MLEKRRASRASGIAAHGFRCIQAAELEKKSEDTLCLRFDSWHYVSAALD